MKPTLRRALPWALIAGGIFAAVGCEQLVGFGEPQLGGTGANGGGTTTSVSTSSTGGGATGGSGSGGNGGQEVFACTPTDPTCTQIESQCIALADNSTRPVKQLRVAQVKMFKPEALASGIQNTLMVQSVTLNLPECYLDGSATFNWLIEFDTTTDRGKLGVSRPVADPFGGFSFVDETVMVDGTPYLVEPTESSATIDGVGNLTVGEFPFLRLPIFLDQSAVDFVLIPLRQITLSDATISDNFNCMGAFNAEGLSPTDACLPDPGKAIYSFKDGGRIRGHIDLEEADDIIINAFNLNRSLCAILVQDNAFIDNGSPRRCKRFQGGEIQFPGDWCSATNTVGSPGCATAVRFDMAFSAQAVDILNGGNTP